MKYPQSLINHFILEEGLVLHKYTDTRGFATIGIGHKILFSETFNTITKEQAISILEKDIDIALSSCIKVFPQYNSFPNNVRLGILDMIFNMGVNNFLGFKKTIKLLNENKFYEASKESLISDWAFQVPNRAKRISALLTG